MAEKKAKGKRGAVADELGGAEHAGTAIVDRAGETVTESQIGDAETVDGSDSALAGAVAQGATGLGAAGAGRGRGGGAVPQPGEQLDRFVVEERIGAGGMGVVVAARDPDLERRVAIKLLRSGSDKAGSEGRARERLVREAQAMAKLSHPNVVAVHAVGTAGDRVFVAMEYVVGQTLGAWLDSEERGWREVLDLFVRAGRGLAAAHDADLVHRDFKPENVLVGDDGRVCVTDFGLVSSAGAVAEVESLPDDAGVRLGGSNPLASSLTRTGTLLGTPLYMAPEQHLRLTADARSDQFSFCVSLYRALYRQPAFSGTAYEALRENVVSGKVNDVPRDTVVPARVEAAVRRGLRADPATRFADMHALLAELGTDPVAGRRRRVAIGVTVVGFALLAGLAAYAFLRGGGEESARCRDAERRLEAVWDEPTKRAIRSSFSATGRASARATYARLANLVDDYARDWAAMHEQACEATWVRREQPERVLDLRMACLERLRSQLGAYTALLAGEVDGGTVDNSVTGAHALTAVEVCADTEALSSRAPMPDDPALHAEVERLSGEVEEARALLRAGKYAASLARVQASRAQAEQAAYAPLLILLLFVQAQAQDGTGDALAARKTLETGVEIAAAAKEDRRLVGLWVKLVWVVGVRLGKPDEALALRESAEAALTRAGAGPKERADYLRVVGVVCAVKGRYDEAEQNYLAAIALLEPLVGPDDPLLAAPLRSLAGVLEERSKLDEALRHYLRALRLMEADLGAEHPRVAGLVNNLAGIYERTADLDESERLYRRALATLEQSLGADHPNVARVLGNLGKLMGTRGDYAAALDYHERALRVFETRLGPDHPSIAIELGTLGTAFLRTGQFAKALAAHQRALAVKRKALGAEHPTTTYPLNGIGTALRALGRREEALVSLREALRVAESGLGPESAQVAIVLTNLGGVYNDLGRHGEALAHCRRALALDRKTLGPEHPDLAHSLACEGQALLGSDRAKECLPPLERALALRQQSGGDSVLLGQSQFAVARALARTKRDPARSRDLATKARDVFAAAGARTERDLAEVDAWLAKRRK